MRHCSNGVSGSDRRKEGPNDVEVAARELRVRLDVLPPLRRGGLALLYESVAPQSEQRRAGAVDTKPDGLKA